ncbi:hypothetical protein PENSPDRAFT_735917 [Peniophora sp. CONT]|nr:hypothetical protein PENSPDRAFT_735917 [Peniophora sp. CONT]
MKTRRKSKASTAATEAPAAESLELTLPDELDVDALSTLLPDVSLENPKGDDILGCYEVLLSRDSELEETRRVLEEVRAECERAVVERDDALHQRESVKSEVEGEMSRTQEELENVRKERDSLKATNHSLQTQVSTITTTTSASSSELEGLKARVADVEREKRDLLAVVSRMKEDAASQDEEVRTLRTTLKDVRHKLSDSESKARALESEKTSLSFRLESSDQQLTLAREEAERASSDLASRSEQHSSERRTLRAELSSLQTAHDELQSQHASVQSRFTALQTAHTTQSSQLSTAQSTIQSLRSRLADQDASYASEISGLKRLVEMMEAREAHGQAIVEGIQADYNGLGARAERREQALRDEADRERARADEAERKRDELERVLEGLQTGELPLPEPTSNGTPARLGLGTSTPIRSGGTPGFGTPESMLSPAAALASRVQRGGRTLTDVYADYVQLQQDYARKCAEHDRMDRTLSQVLDEIQERAPVLAQQRAEYERLKSEADDLAERLHEALAQRDQVAGEAADYAAKFKRVSGEKELLMAQLKDMGAQVQGLMKALARAQDPHLPPDEELEGMAVEADNIDAVISNELVLVASIPALQARNQQLLALVRKLGEEMEGEEREYRRAVEDENNKALQEAARAIEALQDEKEDARRAGEVQAKALIKERDTLRAMLERSTGSRQLAIEAGSTGEEVRELEEVQAQFAAFREEADVDGARLRELAFGAQREVAEVQALLAKANANVEFLKERQTAASDRAAQQQRELDALSTRHAQAQAQFAAADARAARFEGELIDARARADRLIGEAANAKAEKRIIESSMSRLLDENRSLAQQNSQLSSLVEKVRVLQDDATHAAERDRHRLERTVETLESQAEELKRQLNDERENLKSTSTRWEVEVRELRGEKDKATTALLKAGEEAAKATANEARLTARVEELTRQVSSAEEKLAVFERRGTTSSSLPDGASRDAQLEAEVADLRAALKVAEVDLANAREHAETFKSIGRANEEALESLTATHEQYTAATGAQIAQLEADRTALEQKVERLQREVLESKKVANDAKRSLTKERDAWSSDRKTLEDTIVELSSSEQSAAAVQAARDEEAQAQSGRVKEAEEKYNREVLAHADALRQLEDVKVEIAQLRRESHENVAGAETARAKLSAAESSWAKQREAMQKEMEDVNARVKELNEQNKVLHGHLESVSAQAAQIRAAGDAATGEGAEGGEGEQDGEMRQVVSWLRREKEMAEMKLELNKQETSRLRAQSTHLARDLDEARAQLSEEREKAAKNAGSEDVHKELVEKIGQMSVLRESNATLRADREAGIRRVKELEGRVEEMSKEIEPLREEVRGLKAEVEAKGGHVRRLEEESARWQARNSQLLAKYERIDPAELQAVRDELTKAQSELEEKSTALTVMTERAEEAEKAVEEAKQARQKFVARANETIGRLKNDNTALKQQITQLTQEKQTLTDQVAAAGTTSTSDTASAAQLEAANAELEKVKAELEKVKAELDVVKVALDAEKAKAVPTVDTSAFETRIAELTKERDELAEKVANAPVAAGTNEEWTAEKATLTAARDSALAEVKTLKESLGKLESEVRGLKQQAGTFQARIKALTEKENKLQQEHAAKIEAAVADAVKNAPADSASSEDVAAKHVEELKALEERLRSEHESALKQALDAASASAATPTTTQPAADPADLEQKLKDAMDSGRKEADAKIRVKDNQLIRVQKRLKDLEAKVLEWEKEGKVPAGSATASPAPRPAAPAATTTPTAPAAAVPPPVVAAATPAPAVASTSTAGGSAPPAVAPVTRAAAARGGAPPAAGIPRKPSLASAAPSTSAPGPAARGRGRGRGGAMRGAPPPAGGVSIMGAAGKRAREENDVGDALAKRLRPAEGGRGGRGRGRGGAGGAGPSGDAA